MFKIFTSTLLTIVVTVKVKTEKKIELYVKRRENIMNENMSL